MICVRLEITVWRSSLVSLFFANVVASAQVLSPACATPNDDYRPSITLCDDQLQAPEAERVNQQNNKSHSFFFFSYWLPWICDRFAPLSTRELLVQWLQWERFWDAEYYILPLVKSKRSWSTSKRRRNRYQISIRRNMGSFSKCSLQRAIM